jgi:DNA-binding NarL/FixJ family response regulator
VLVVDDHMLLAEALAVALRKHGLDVMVAPTHTEGAILAAARHHRPDVVLLDLMLGHLSGQVLIGPLLAATGASVLMLTGTTDRARMGECLEAGAVGVASKSVDFQELLDQLLAVICGRPPLLDGDRHALLGELRARRAEEQRRLAPFRCLTPREQAVLAALMDGKRAKQIAAESFVSLGTVRAQIKSILLKLAVSSQLSAVALARQAGWSPSGTVPDLP